MRHLAAAMIVSMLLLPVGAGSLAIARAQVSPDFIQPEIAPGTVPDEIPGVGVDERFDAPVPADAILIDHEGRAVRLGDLFDGERPVLLTLVYHQCASFCDMVLPAVARALAQQPWTAGIEYDVITLSIDPRDTPAVLASTRSRILGHYGRAEAERGWHFLAGTEAQIRQITDAVGYRYQWDERTQQFAHPGVIMLLQPSGRVARYLYGLEFPHNDVRIGLLEASEGRHLASVEQAILYCFRWDHADGRYVLAARRLMKAGGVLTMVILGGVLLVFWRREGQKKS
jgi:protein SCO1/2